MNQMRAIVAGQARGSLLAERARPKRREGDEPSLSGLTIPRTEARTCNQRREDRHLNVVDRAELRFRRRKIDVAVLNVSRHGAMIEAAIEPRIGERMQISFEGCNRTDCTVRWIRNGRVGLEFSQETVVQASAAVKELVVSGRRGAEREPEPEPKPAAQAQGERPPRQSLLWKALLHWDHGTFAIRVRNISAEGAMLEGAEELAEGTGVVIDLGEGGIVPGVVRWSRSGQFGVRFDSRFDLRALARPERPAGAVPRHLKPDYLGSELDPESPWAAAWDKLDPEDFSEAE
jgi:hypothetical protein